jgi:hypothetical protein
MRCAAPWADPLFASGHPATCWVTCAAPSGHRPRCAARWTPAHACERRSLRRRGRPADANHSPVRRTSAPHACGRPPPGDPTDSRAAHRNRAKTASVPCAHERASWTNHVTRVPFPSLLTCGACHTPLPAGSARPGSELDRRRVHGLHHPGRTRVGLNPTESESARHSSSASRCPTRWPRPCARRSRPASTPRKAK